MGMKNGTKPSGLDLASARASCTPNELKTLEFIQELEDTKSFNQCSDRDCPEPAFGGNLMSR